VLRKPAGVDIWFGMPVNCAAPLGLLAGLVETDGYAHPVNLVVHRPSKGDLHVRCDDVIAQIFFLDRDMRRAEIEVLEQGAPGAVHLREELRQWFLARHQDRST